MEKIVNLFTSNGNDSLSNPANNNYTISQKLYLFQSRGVGSGGEWGR
ncbi:MAG: hypothetical protein F6K22_03785 [Okeania sp. SIO2F4]|nr:hypothetical protein [Okeania sp. SIO2F4]NES02026.1 hypothetical protein [Okeania sp. SIO2F4]